MLKSLEFENFKSWGGRHRLDFGRITGLFGANSSGKSSIIHLLLLLKQTAESQDQTLVLNLGGHINSYIDLGGFRDIITDHNTSKNFSYALDWMPKSQLGIHQGYTIHNIGIYGILKALLGTRGEEVLVDQLKYQIDCTLEISYQTDDFEYMGDAGSISGLLAVSSTRSKPVAHKMEASFDGDVHRKEHIDRAPAPLGLYKFDPESIHDLMLDFDFLHKIETVEMPGVNQDVTVSAHGVISTIERAERDFRRLLENMVYLGPLRIHPSRNYTWTGIAPATVGIRGEQAIQVLLAEKSISSKVVSKWLRQLGLAASISLKQVGYGARIWEPIIKRREEGTEVNLADMGFGISQVLPVIVALLSASPGSLVILEHPDLHLHPRAQAELADLLVEVASAGEIQILVESHSEHLLARIQRRISESSRGDGSLSPEDVRLYFCEQQKGRSKLTPLEMQASGVITNWPRDFFGDMLAERMALSGFYPKSDDHTQTADG